MKLFLLIAIVATIALILLVMQRGRTRVTTIEHRRERDDEKGENR